ncbi:MAG: Mur ligase domain-containing protein, partial [Candidatus Peregrinibacteria bacterium]
MKISQAKYIHFVGIGGIGTSAVAQILKARGKIISGSDTVPSDITKSLKNSGIKVSIGHSEKTVSRRHQLVIYSPAIPKNNPELAAARRLKIETLSYPQALGELSKDYFTIAISGTHGKSTTTAMTALILEKGGLDPTVVIGTKIRQFGNKNFRIGKSKYLVLEACEYKRSFLEINPDILIITNIEAEHLDYYKNLADYKSAFTQLAKKVPASGFIIIDPTDKNAKSAVKPAKAKIMTIVENSLSPHP